MQKTLTVGRTYAVTTSTTCDVTDANGTIIVSAAAGQQVVFVAPTAIVNFSDDTASVVAVFKLALAKTRLLEQLGGGRPLMPALFLESTGEQYINTRLHGGFNINAEFYAAALNDANSAAFGWIDMTNSPEMARYHWSPLNYRNMFWCQIDSVGLSASVNLTGWSVGRWSKIQIFPAQGSAVINGTEGNFTALDPNYQTIACFGIFGRLSDSGAVQARPSRFQYVTFYENNKIIMNLTAVIGPQGVPCMFDSVTKRMFYNSGTGAFIVGMTAEQARKLDKMPSGGGSLTVSLPAAIVDGETVLDAAVQAALDAAASKGWDITIQTYTEA